MKIDVTPAFATLSNNPNTEAIYETLPLLERFVVLMYDRTSNCVSAKEALLDLFPQEPEWTQFHPRLLLSCSMFSEQPTWQAIAGVRPS